MDRDCVYNRHTHTHLNEWNVLLPLIPIDTESQRDEHTPLSQSWTSPAVQNVWGKTSGDKWYSKDWTHLLKKENLEIIPDTLSLTLVFVYNLKNSISCPFHALKIQKKNLKWEGSVSQSIFNHLASSTIIRNVNLGNEVKLSTRSHVSALRVPGWILLRSFGMKRCCNSCQEEQLDENQTFQPSHSSRPTFYLWSQTDTSKNK